MHTVSIRQPGYLPYMGFFKKIQFSDTFVMLDDVQYERGDWDNRNKIRTSEGSILLTVPIFNKFGSKLNEVKIDHSKNWIKKHVGAIKLNYQKAPFFEEFFPEIKSILEKKHEKLIDLNLEFINYVITKLKIETTIVKSSELDIQSKGSQRLLDICKKLHGTTYLSGELGIGYLEKEVFLKNNINVVFEKFAHPIYKQCYKEFIPNLSIIDVLFNEGIVTKSIIEKAENI